MKIRFIGMYLKIPRKIPRKSISLKIVDLEKKSMPCFCSRQSNIIYAVRADIKY